MLAVPVDQIDRLVQETFSLWNLQRIGFSWQAYYLNHTYRIRDLSLAMAPAEAADPEVLLYAALLHDITKRYDGNMLKDDCGNTVHNEQGFWLNEMVLPHQHNWVTRLYDRLELAGQVHHQSGAELSDAVLLEYGVRQAQRRLIAEIIRGHLKPERLPPAELKRLYRKPETRILYDADTIDPNCGLPAFYRNVQICAGFALARGERLDLRGYVEGVSGWVNRKDEFIGRMLTESGRQVAASRQEDCRRLLRVFTEELQEFELNRRYGVIGCVGFLMKDAEDPSLRRHARELAEEWLPQQRLAAQQERGEARTSALEALTRAEAFARHLQEQIAGQDAPGSGPALPEQRSAGDTSTVGDASGPACHGLGYR